MPNAHPLILLQVSKNAWPNIPLWDLIVILEALCSPPFEPLESIDVK